ncbi:gonadotropin subunit beta-1-like [Odontesthes bonariensis]|uniref:gonadotropin subunit beta-1-like isoform X1 n=2 Tax=Odontesthes bonariensis TaxID=219752 RepID=UPI003F58F488
MRDLVPSCGRHLCCIRQMMQLVVIAAVLALAEMEQGCHLDCYPKNVSIPVESCGTTEFIHTTICEGLCFNKDSVFISPAGHPEQKICIGDWYYEVKYTEGCPVGVTYPVARNCKCGLCNTVYTDCGRLQSDIC